MTILKALEFIYFLHCFMYGMVSLSLKWYKLYYCILQQSMFCIFLETSCDTQCNSQHRHTGTPNSYKRAYTSRPHIKMLIDKSTSFGRFQQPIGVHSLPNSPIGGCAGRDQHSSLFLVRNAYRCQISFIQSYNI